MKEITKKIETTIYVAEDGTEFKNIHQCEKYELKKGLVGFRMLDSELNIMYDTCGIKYIYFNNKQGMLNFIYGIGCCMTNGLDTTRFGLYIWNDIDGKWFPYDDFIQSIIDEGKEILKLLNK